MKRVLAILLVLSLVLVACQPTQPKAETTPEPVAPAPTTETKAPAPVEKEVMEPPKKLAPLGMDIEKSCELLLPAHTFADICGLKEADIVSTQKASEKTCWVTFTDRNNKAWTAGFTAVDWLNAEESNREFDRGIGMRRVPEEKDGGERAYKDPEVDRENIVWVKSKYLTRIGASTKLCTKDQLLKLAQEVDGRLG